MERNRRFALIITVVMIMILVALTGLLVYRTQLNGYTDGHCWGNPIGLMVTPYINQTTGNASWKVTAVSVRSECISNRLVDLIVAVSDPNGTVIEHDTIQNLVTRGNAVVMYHDVTPPASTVDVADYFEIPVSAAPDGTHFFLLEKSSGSELTHVNLI
jgi:hypothetical protein